MGGVGNCIWRYVNVFGGNFIVRLGSRKYLFISICKVIIIIEIYLNLLINICRCYICIWSKVEGVIVIFGKIWIDVFVVCIVIFIFGGIWDISYIDIGNLMILGKFIVIIIVIFIVLCCCSDGVIEIIVVIIVIGYNLKFVGSVRFVIVLNDWGRSKVIFIFLVCSILFVFLCGIIGSFCYVVLIEDYMGDFSWLYIEIIR